MLVIFSLLALIGFDSLRNLIPLTIGAGLLIYLLCFHKIVRSNVRKNVNKIYSQGKNSTIGTHKYFISAEGIRDISEVDDTTMKWEAIGDVVQTNTHLYILVRPSSALIIPKRAFSDDAAFGEAAQKIKAIFQISQTQSVS